MKTRGYVVLTDSGKGLTRHSNELVNGKVIVELIDASFRPVLENGKPKKILCEPSKIKIIGYID